jgi:SAM-dependent methyltransferase
MAKKNGLNPYPQVVAELGPGDSLGIGLAALISGSERYLGFDIVEHANVKRNLKVFDELVALFNNKVDIPGYDEFPDVKPYLDKYNFPSDILNESRLNYAMKKSRLVRIRNSITNTYYRDSLIKYKVPWYDADVIEEESVDMIYSQAVLEHVDDLVNTYRAMYLWLKPNGYISHQIDGHWTYSDFMWKLIRGKRSYLLNRETHSKHVEIIENEDFRIECEKRIKSKSNLSTDDLAPRFKSITDDDLTTSGSFIQALK